VVWFVAGLWCEQGGARILFVLRARRQALERVAGAPWVQKRRQALEWVAGAPWVQKRRRFILVVPHSS